MVDVASPEFRSILSEIEASEVVQAGSSRANAQSISATLRRVLGMSEPVPSLKYLVENEPQASFDSLVLGDPFFKGSVDLLKELTPLLRPNAKVLGYQRWGPDGGEESVFPWLLWQQVQPHLTPVEIWCRQTELMMEANASEAAAPVPVRLNWAQLTRILGTRDYEHAKLLGEVDRLRRYVRELESRKPSLGDRSSLLETARLADKLRISEMSARLGKLERDNSNLRLEIGEIARQRWWRLGHLVKSVAKNPSDVWSLSKDALSLVRKAPVQHAKAQVTDQSVNVVAHQDLLQAGDRVGAVEAANARLREEPRDLQAWQTIRSAAVALGMPSEQHRAARGQYNSKRSTTYLRSARIAAGRLRELDPSFVPRLGSLLKITPASDARVLHLIKGSFPYTVRGATIRSHYTLMAQLEVGLDPVAVTELGYPRSIGIDEFQLVEEVEGIRHHRLDLGYRLNANGTPFDEQLRIWAVLAARVLQAERPRLIHAASGSRGYENAVVGLALRERFRLPLVYEVRSFHEATWTHDSELGETSELYELRTARENACMQGADAVVTLSQSMKEELVKRGINASKIVVVPNAVDSAKFVPMAPDEALRRELGFRPGVPVIGYISNLSFREGQDFLLRATRNLIDSGTEVHTLIVGDGPEEQRLRSLLAELSLGSHAVMTGAVPHSEISRYYSLIDVFVIPRRDDHASRFVTPLKPFEAMALGKALAVSSTPALLEVIGNGARGMAFETENVGQLTEVIRSLVLDPERRKQLGARSREWVRTERTWRRNAERYRELYRSMF